jgi:hypothetical protein
MERLGRAFDWLLSGLDDGSWFLIDLGHRAEVGKSVRHCERAGSLTQSTVNESGRSSFSYNVVDLEVRNMIE